MDTGNSYRSSSIEMSFLHKIEDFLAGPEELVVPIKSSAIDSTFTIVLVIFGLAYCLQPRVDDAYRKGKAYLGWHFFHYCCR